MPDNEPSEITDLIAKYLSGHADPDEVKTLIKWIESSDLNKKYYDEVRNIWEVSSSDITPDTINVEYAFSKVMDQASGKSKLSIAWNYWKKIAAVIFIPLLLGNIMWFYLDSQKGFLASEPVYNEIFAAYGTRTAIELADGSSVWLNSGSSLKYPERFKGKERAVYLKGEAYFEVEGNKAAPFIVNTPMLAVKATGTKFNVSDHVSEINPAVTLVTGKVFVNQVLPDSGMEQSIELFPGQHMVLNKDTRKALVRNEDVNEYISWKDGKLIFRNKPLSYVVNKISQTFNVDIELRGNVLQDYRYRATFEEESLNEILKLLKISSPIDYKEVRRDPLPDGSFPKRKVIIFPRGEAGQN
jgi:transmembrane sensor